MISAIIQVRVSSTRLPNKVFADINGKPLLWYVVDRLKKSIYLDNIIIATTDNIADDLIQDWASENKISCFRGSESNVLKRYYDAAKNNNSTTIVRITADDPFKDYKIMDEVINKFLSKKADFGCNNFPPSYPEGLDIEVFSFSALETAYKNSVSDFEKEHVTQYFYKNRNDFKIVSIKNDTDLSNLRWTIDTKEDLEMTREVYNKFTNNKFIYLMKDILKILNENPEILEINKKVKRSIMYKSK
jgi:spore coat polysaccharide biosynthesis protein SpsF